MPVDHRTKQPAGVLHGGASVALAETLGSWGAAFAVDRAKHHCVGIEINANHVRPVSGGYVTGIARPIQLGRTLHVWEVRISDEKDKLVCISRVTMAVLNVAMQYLAEAVRRAPRTGRQSAQGDDALRARLGLV